MMYEILFMDYMESDLTVSHFPLTCISVICNGDVAHSTEILRKNATIELMLALYSKEDVPKG